MALFDKLTKATQDAVRGAKDMTDVARLNSLLTEEQTKIEATFNQLGKAYYGKHEENIPEPLGGLCVSILESEKKIAYYNEEIKKIKGAINCSECGAINPNNSVYCINCGARMNPEDEAKPAVQRFCTNCGTGIEQGAAFCFSCGQKI